MGTRGGISCGECDLEVLLRYGGKRPGFAIRSVGAGEAVSNVPDRAVLWVKRGRIVDLASRPTGRRGPGSIRGPGTVAGLAASFGAAAAWEAVALEESEVCVVPGDQLRRAAETPDGAQVLLRCAAEEAAAFRRESFRTSLPAMVRVARLLLDEGDLAGVPHHLLAMVLAMRPETLSRAVAELRRRGVLSRAGLQVTDVQALRRIATTDP